MKTCLVLGYINKNLGDDLFFRILFKRYTNIKFYFYPPSEFLTDYKNIFKKNKNVIFYDKEEYYKKIREEITDEKIPINLFPMICEKAKEVDSMIIIGGSLFIQNPEWKKDDRFILKDLIGNKPSFIVGCNFGPGDKEFYEYYKEWFKKFDDVCFRDKISFKLFKKLDNTRRADDIVLIGSEKRLLLSRRNKRCIGISIIDITNKKNLKDYKEDYFDFLRNTINFFQKDGYKINLFSFCEKEGDLKAINELLETIDNKTNINVINYDNNIDNFLFIFQQCEYIVSTRFHAAILALKYKQSFIPLVYSEKTKNFLKDVDGRIKTYDIKRIKDVKIEKVYFNKVIRRYNAEKQFEIIDKYLKG